MIAQIESGLRTVLKQETAPETVAKLADFLQAMLEKNKVMNLTAITEPHQVVALHLLDSAALLPYLPTEGKTLLDVGTGAGFPGIPLKILKPDLDVTLLDALQKRLDWLDEVCGDLGLTDIRSLHGRGEEISHDSTHREGYDIATARAVADLGILAELVLPLVKVGGHFLAMKSTHAQEEIQMALPAIQAMGGKKVAEVVYPIPGMDLSHSLIIMEKVSETPLEYPRRWAKIKNTPIRSGK